MTESIAERVARLVRPEVRALNAYHVASAAGLIKLDAMESPYTWPTEMVDGWLEMLRGVELNRYPDAAANAVRERVHTYMKVPKGVEVLLGNGSDELIQIVAMALGGPGRTVMAPAPSFVMYEIVARSLGMEFVGVPLAADFGLDEDSLLQALERRAPALLFLAYPNNPTGNLFDRAVVERVIAAAPGLVVLDEAYFPYAQRSFMPELERFPNLVVMRTVSKIGLAGLRLGVLAGHPDWLGEFEKVRLPYNISALTQASAEFALAHYAVFDEHVQRICTERRRLEQRMQALDGVHCFPTATNFILFRTGQDPARLTQAIREAGVLIKNLHQPNGPLAGCLRVSVGQPTENDAFLDALAGGL
ncbi:MAG: histidinol-phosphate transaminase [Gammaproteobacteria bacterium]|nr:histidinol-phosphate transaminase [Gammaproteobacteria bacterium]